MKLMTNVLISSIFCLCFLNVTAQQRQSPFKAGIIAGINISQVDGDYQFGYDKVGYNFGLRGGFMLSKRFDIMTELLYTQKGTKPKMDLNPNNREATIDYKYAEVPIFLQHHFRKNNSGFYSVTAFVGATYGRLLKSSTLIVRNFRMDTVATNSLSQDKLNKSEISLIFGFNINVLQNLSLSFSHTTSLTNVYQNPNLGPAVPQVTRRENYVAFRNYFATVQLIYDFIAPKVTTKKKTTKRK